MSVSLLSYSAKKELAIVCKCGHAVCVVNRHAEQLKQRHLCPEFDRMSFHIDGHVIRFQYLYICEVAVSCDAYGEL